jgi:hypothetical protein
LYKGDVKLLKIKNLNSIKFKSYEEEIGIGTDKYCA